MKFQLPLPAEDCLHDLYGAAMAGRLTKDFAHQIGNCLFGIMGYTEVLLANMAENDPQRRRVRIIEEQATGLKRLIDGLTEMSSQKESPVELIDIQKLVQQIVLLLHNPAVKAGVTVTEEYQEELPQLNIESARLKRAICSILHYSIGWNSMKHVHISVSSADERVEIRITGASPTDGEMPDQANEREGSRLTLDNLPLHVGRMNVDELGGELTSSCENKVMTFTIALEAGMA
ncbi:MAG: hypothetical protein OEV28_02805 [Nitrospirota bacterium]|nr:hypothetical protein [Nitrospirota bacterium]